MIEIKELENKEENWQLLKEVWFSFHDNTPINSVIDGFRTEEGRTLLEKCLREMVQSSECPILIAWDTEKHKVVGASLHQIDRRDRDITIPYHNLPGTYKYGKYKWPHETQQQLDMKTDFFLNNLILPLRFFEHYSDETCWNLNFLSVLPEYGGQGLGIRLTEHSLSIARSLGIRISKSNFASTFSIKIGLKCGFEPVLEAEYKQYYKHYHQMSEELTRLHPKCVAMVKRL